MFSYESAISAKKIKLWDRRLSIFMPKIYVPAYTAPDRISGAYHGSRITTRPTINKHKY